MSICYLRMKKKYNYKVVNPKPLTKDNKIVSSSLIRNLLENGFLKKANKLLDRNWTIQGVVQKGRQVGKKNWIPNL